MRVNRRRRGLGLMAIMSLLSVGMMLLPLITGGESPLSGITSLFGGGKSEKAEKEEPGKKESTSSSSHILPPLPKLRTSTNRTSITPVSPAPSANVSAPVVPQQTHIRGMGAPSTSKMTPRVKQQTHIRGMPASSSKVTPAYKSSKSSFHDMDILTAGRESDRAYSDLKEALISGDRTEIQSLDAAYRTAKANFEALKAGN